MDIVNSINTVVWVLSNIILAYTALALVVFVIIYYALFDPSATTGGKLMFRFKLSLVGVVGLIFIGIFVDPSPNRAWFTYPEGMEVWRPMLRLIVYGYVAFTISSLAVYLIRRKWFPARLKVAPNLEFIKVRNETNEIPIVKPHDEVNDETK